MAQKGQLEIVLNARDNASKQISNVSNSISGLKSGLKVLGVAVGAAMIGKFAADLAIASANAERTKIVFSQLSASIGGNVNSINELRTATQGMVNDIDLMKSANRAVKLNVVKDMSEMTRLFKVATLFGKQMGTTTTQAINDIATGIGRNSPLILDNLGIITKGWAEEAKAAGVAYDQAFILNKVLEQGEAELAKYGDETLTAGERMAVMKAQVDNLKNRIGNALIPVLEIMMGELAKVFAWLEADSKGANYFGKTLIVVVRIISLFAKAVIAVIKTVKGFIKIFASAGKVVFMAAKDMVVNIINVGKVASSVFSGIGKAIKGDFAGAKATIADALGGMKSNFQDTAGAVANMADTTESEFTNILGALDAVGASMDIFNFEGLKPAIDNYNQLGTTADKVLNGLGEKTDGAKGKNDEMKKSVEELEKAYTDFDKESSSALSQVVQNIARINEEMNKLLVKNAEDTLDWKFKVAEAYVGQEEKVAELQKQVNAETDNEKRALLQQELDRQRQVLEEKAHLESAYGVQINEIRRRNSLTDFERKMEDLNKDIMVINSEFAQKKKALEDELEIEKQKADIISKINESAVKENEKFLAQMEVATVQSVNQQIAYYNALAEAIAKAKAGETSAQISAASGVYEKATQEISKPESYTVNINGPISSKDDAEQVGDIIMRKLNYNMSNF